MSTFFLTAIAGIAITEDLGRGDQFADAAFVTNNWPYIERRLSRQFETQCGKLEYEFLKSAKLWVYSEAPRVELRDLLPLVIDRLRLVAALLNHLWLVKDNAANCDTGYAFVPTTGGEHFASNVLALHYSTADGSEGVSQFSRDEVRQAREQFLTLGYDPADGSGGLPDLQESEQRLERAHYFAQAARAQGDLGLKVGYYCSAFEALFASAPTELAHQLSERVAVFLEESAAAKLEIFRVCKRAYRVRSQVFHGARVDARETAALAVSLDAYLRSTLRTILTSEPVFRLFRRRPDDFEERMIRLVLGEARDQVIEG